MALKPDHMSGVETADPVRPSGIRDRDVITMSYPPRLMAPDLAKSLVGMLVCLVIVVIPNMMPLLRWTAAGLAVLFVLYFLRTVVRFQSRLFVSEYGLRLHSLWGGTAFAWPELSKFRLRYFSTRRDGTRGWFELALFAGESKIVAESSLDGFGELLDMARDWAKDNQLLLDDITRTNLIRMDEAHNLVRAAVNERMTGTGEGR